MEQNRQEYIVKLISHSVSLFQLHHSGINLKHRNAWTWYNLLYFVTVEF